MSRAYYMYVYDDPINGVDPSGMIGCFDAESLWDCVGGNLSDLGNTIGEYITGASEQAECNTTPAGMKEWCEQKYGESETKKAGRGLGNGVTFAQGLAESFVGGGGGTSAPNVAPNGTGSLSMTQPQIGICFGVGKMQIAWDSQFGPNQVHSSGTQDGGVTNGQRAYQQAKRIMAERSPGDPTVATVASGEPAIHSGWSYRTAQGFHAPVLDKVFALAKKMKFKFKEDIQRDQGSTGRFYASHAEVQMAALMEAGEIPKQPIGVSINMCSEQECARFFQALANYSKQEWTVYDPSGPHPFRPTGGE